MQTRRFPRIPRPKKLAPHRHTGTRLPHHHTSYAGLLFLLLLTTVLMTAMSWSAAAVDQSGQPSSYATFAVVPGPEPKSPPIIQSPGSGQSFTSVPQTVSGSCPGGTLIKLFKNGVLGGATLCDNGRFSLPVDLFIGSNALTAAAYNTLDEASPDSPTVTVQFALPGASPSSPGQLSSPSSPGNQFVITAQVYHRGAEAGQVTNWPLTITGGVAPYAISVGWGDGKTDLYSRGEAGTFTVSHTYAKAGSGQAGSYPIIVQGSDSGNNHAYLQLVAIIAGPANVGQGGASSSGNAGLFGLPSFNNGLQLAWPLLGAAILMVISFLIGEWREKQLLKNIKEAPPSAPPPILPPTPPASPAAPTGGVA